MSPRIPVILSVALLALTAGCSFDPDCGTRAECLGLDVCTDGTCGMSGDAGVDQSATNNGQNNGGNNGQNNNGEADMEQPSGECGDPATCGAEEPNDGAGSPYFLEEDAVGCDFDEVDRWQTSLGTSLCSQDRDYYALELATCRTRAYVVEARLTPAEGCEADARFDIFRYLYDCNHDRVECIRLEDGTLVIQALVPSADPPEIHEIVWGIKAHDDIGFDYELEIEVRP